ncbi:heterokaryon incompatibility protein-domain-containing protein [Xylaria scruposa]|nr:heterokaryon incompatibility protein-domain-containing protein [Xylaria scruposa]
MAGGSIKKDGEGGPTDLPERQKPSLGPRRTGIKRSAQPGKDGLISSGFSHLASRVMQDWQRFGQHVNDMPYFSTQLSTDDCIRLLTLKAGTCEDPVECELSIENVNNLPPFEALSYAWGDPEDRTPITVTGETFRVTVNLATALRHLRYPDRPRLLWVDALCIDQRNILEVNQQVQYMVDIYASATGVLAWLGPDDGSASLGFDALRSISDTISQDEINHLTALFDRPYWDRLWVVQELVLARDVQFVCGPEYLPWVAVDRFFRCRPSDGLMPFDLLPPVLREPVYRLRHIWHAREIKTGGRHLTFSQLLNKYNPCRCSVTKDYTYSLLGLASSSSAINQLIQPDYSSETSIEDVFRNTTAAAILEDQSLNVLCLVRRHSDHHFGNKPRPLPMKSSWVGDWSCVRVIRPLIEPDNTEQLYAAYKPGHFSREENLAFKDFGILKVRGAIFGKLESINAEVNHFLEGWERDVKSWEPSDIRNYQYPSGEDAVNAFWRTLIMDDSFAPFYKAHERLTPPRMDEYRDLYLQWRYETGHSSKEGGRSFAQCLRWGPKLNTLAGWTFAVMSNGYFARVQPDAKKGDVVVLLQGSAVPFVLRPVNITEYKKEGRCVQVDDAWRLVGTAYVHGIMDGEAVLNGLLSPEQDFYIV